MKVEAFRSCFLGWLNSLVAAPKEKSRVSSTENTHTAIDGKTMKGSHNRANGLGGEAPCQCLDFGLTIAQVATEEETE